MANFYTFNNVIISDEGTYMFDVKEKIKTKLNLRVDNLEVKHLLHSSKKSFLQSIINRSTLLIILLSAQIIFLAVMFLSLKNYMHIWFGSFFFLTICVLVFNLNSKSHPMIKLSWSLIIAVFQPFGALFYIITYFDFAYYKEKKRLKSELAEAEKYLPLTEDRSDFINKLHLKDPYLYELDNFCYKNGGFFVSPANKVKYYADSKEAWLAKIECLKEAEDYIFLEYFIIEEGQMFGAILNVLSQKASEGVKIYLLYDGSCSFSTLPHNYPKLLKNLGINCKLYAPIRPLISTHYNNRDHRKILIVDGKTAFTGGMNLADEYINVKERFGYWKDAAVKIEGPAVNNFIALFIQMYNASSKTDILVYDNYLRYAAFESFDTFSEEDTVYAMGFGSSPFADERLAKMIYLHLINTARKNIYIMSPYLILDNDFMTALIFAAQRNLDVRIVLPSIPDNKFAHELAQSNFESLLKSGVKIYSFLPGYVHAKVLLIDNIKAVVGTINLDYRSLYLNFECACYLQADETKVRVLKDIENDFRLMFEKSELINWQQITTKNYYNRIVRSFLKIAAPLF